MRFLSGCCGLVCLLLATSANADSFFDDFNRPNRSSIGNGWSDVTGVTGKFGIQSGKAALLTYNSHAGIYRPFNFDDDVTVSATIYEMSNGSNQNRYVGGFSFWNDGVYQHGISVQFTRTDSSWGNSSVMLWQDSKILQTLSSSFQFGSFINVELMFQLNGLVSGQISDGSHVYNFTFLSLEPIKLPPSSNIAFYSEPSSSGDVARLDDFTISTPSGGDLPEPSGLVLIGIVGVLGCRRGR